MILDIIAAVILVGFVVFGVVRGLKLTALWLIGMVLSYVAAIIAPMVLSSFVATKFELPRMVAAFVTSLAALFIVSTIFSIIRAKIRRDQRSEAKAEKIIKSGVAVISKKNRAFGGLLGGLSGILVAAFVGWCYDLASAGPLGSKLPDASGSHTAKVSRNVVFKAVSAGTMLGTRNADTARFAGAVVSRPSRTIEGVNLLLANPAIKQLAKDPAFFGAFYSGDGAALMKHVGLARVLNDLETQNILRAMGVMPKGGVVEIPPALAKAGAKLADMVNNPELKDAVQGLQRDGLFEQGQALSLVMDPRFQAIIDNFVGGDKPAAAAVADPAAPAAAPVAKPAKK